MFLIREQHRRALEEAEQEGLVRRAAQTLRRHHGPELKGVPDTALREIITAARTAADACLVGDPDSVVRFCELWVALGEGFHQRPPYSAIAHDAILAPEKVRRLFNAAVIERLGPLIPPDAQFMVCRQVDGKDSRYTLIDLDAEEDVLNALRRDHPGLAPDDDEHLLHLGAAGRPLLDAFVSLLQSQASHGKEEA